MSFHPIMRYHAILAPTGRKFTDEAEFTALGEDWVDTPAKLVPVEPEAPAFSGKRGTKRGTTGPVAGEGV